MKAINLKILFSVVGLLFINLLFILSNTNWVFPTFGGVILEIITLPILFGIVFMFGYTVYKSIKLKNLNSTEVICLLLINGLSITLMLLNWR